MSDTSVKSLWQKYDAARSTLLQRARDCAALTIPALLPPDGSTGNTELPTPYQGLGARGVNNLASKLLLALLPPSSPFFRLLVDAKLLAQLGDKKADVEEQLAGIERSVMDEVESQALRVNTFEAIKLLIATGNSLLFLEPAGGLKTYRLDQYVCKRDPVGNPLEIIVKEQISPIVLSAEVRAEAKLDEDTDPTKPVDVFTYVKRGESNWEAYQEINGIRLESTTGTYPLEECPWLPLRWTAAGDYGRGLIEEYLGDLRSLEGLTEACMNAASASSKVIFLVSANGTTSHKTLADTPSGGFAPGDASDVHTLKVDKMGDLQVAFKVIEEIQARLAHAFLMNASVQRDAERVSASEIQFMASELEDALGGVYSVLSQEFQLPMVKLLMSQMRKKGTLPQLPKKSIKPAIITGLQALGRGHDLNKLGSFISFITPLGDAAYSRMNVGDLIKRAGTSLGIDMNGLVKDEEQVQQEQQYQMLMQTLQQAGPGVLQNLTKGAANGGNIPGTEGTDPEAGAGPEG